MYTLVWEGRVTERHSKLKGKKKKKSVGCKTPVLGICGPLVPPIGA